MESIKYNAFLRGINVGGHHKVPMQELRNEMETLGFSEVATLLNSGNVIFKTEQSTNLESKIEVHLKQVFGFAIPVIVKSADEILDLLYDSPFQGINGIKKLTLYVTFLKNKPKVTVPLPYISEDKSFQILAVRKNIVFSTIDLSKGKTIKAMETLEKKFGKDITTRNWNTILKFGQK